MSGLFSNLVTSTNPVISGSVSILPKVFKVLAVNLEYCPSFITVRPTMIDMLSVVRGSGMVRHAPGWTILSCARPSLCTQNRPSRSCHNPNSCYTLAVVSAEFQGLWLQ